MFVHPDIYPHEMKILTELIWYGFVMLGTLTSEGQLPLPKQIRKSLGLQAGSLLDFSIGTSGETKGLLVARPLTKTVLGLAGLLKRPGKAAVSLKAMDQAVLDIAAALHSKAIAKGRSNT
ncbi:MAG: AbrB/MazE/SpoVT family DNA-binding domain-containing protein [Rhodoferax sp.]|nr:AbrB/MazE/SpoVT family DNA-binding domain-containing protein [Rhodoferax sp.]